MKTWKLVSGILSTVLFLVVAFQSCAAGVVDAIEGQGGTSGGAGILVGILMLSGGIVSIATSKSALCPEAVWDVASICPDSKGCRFDDCI